MPKSHYKLDLELDTSLLRAQLELHPYLWDKYNIRRTAPGSPHGEMQDIWIRYNNIEPFLKSGDFSGFADEHDSIWYSAYDTLWGCKNIIFDVMHAVNGERLGGVLITKLPPGGKIVTHVDGGWHADYYDKYYVPIQNELGAIFGFEDGIIEPKKEGEVWFFDNHHPHWVRNDSKHDRLAMIICVRRTGTSSDQRRTE